MQLLEELSGIIKFIFNQFLKKFLTDQGKIIPAHVTGVSAKYQRMLTREIKKARILALLPFIVDPREN